MTFDAAGANGESILEEKVSRKLINCFSISLDAVTSLEEFEILQ